MSHSTHPLHPLLRRDRRYKPEAYFFVREALSYAQEVLGMGAQSEADEDDERWIDELEDLDSQLEQQLDEDMDSELEDSVFLEDEDDDEEECFGRERHITGQQLCHAIREYALDQYGLMAQTVLKSWGVTCTADFGEIVFNLIEIGLMKKSDSDDRGDFNDVYDFDDAFKRGFRFVAD